MTGASDELRVLREGRYKLGINFDPDDGLPADFITFEPMIGIAPARPFAYSFAVKHGLRSVHIVPPGPDWYQYPDIYEFLGTLKKYVGPDTFSYGSSMGGYAVLHLSDALGVARGVAMSPLFSIHHGVVPDDRRWYKVAEKLVFHVDESFPDAKAKIWAFTDPLDRDAKHIPKMSERPGIEIVNIPYGGHGVAQPMQEAGILDTVLTAFVRNEENELDATALFEANREKSSYYFYMKGTHETGHDRVASMRRSLELRPDHRMPKYGLGLALFNVGEKSEGVRLLHESILDKGLCDEFMIEYFKLCYAEGITPDVEPHCLPEYDKLIVRIEERKARKALRAERKERRAKRKARLEAKAASKVASNNAS